MDGTSQDSKMALVGVLHYKGDEKKQVTNIVLPSEENDVHIFSLVSCVRREMTTSVIGYGINRRGHKIYNAHKI